MLRRRTITNVRGGSSTDENTLLLLHFADNFSDSSPFARATTNDGAGFTTIAKFGKAADFTSGRLLIPSSSWFDTLLSSGTFTLEAWVYYNYSSNKSIISKDTSGDGNGTNFGWRADIGFYFGNWGNYIVGGNGYAISNTWNHIAVVAKNGTYYFFVNGNLAATKSFVPVISSYNMYIGGRYGSSDKNFAGYIDEVRISDIARWTTTFTPPTSPY